MSQYRDLITGDIVQLGDEWFNPDWEVDGPWFIVKEGNEMIGRSYVAETMRPMRRPL